MEHYAQENKVRCCLIQLYGDLQPANTEPLSIETLAGAISSSIPTAIIDLQTFGNFQTSTEQNDLLTKISNQKYNLIGLSCPQGTYELALDILHSVYKHPYPPYMVLGHALPSSLPDLFLTQFPQVLIIRGWGEAVKNTQHYIFRGATGRYVAPLLQKHGNSGLSCSVLLIDPRATTAIQAYVMNRYGDKTDLKPLREYEEDTRQEIFQAIVHLFDLRQRFRIEVRTCFDHLFHRSEIADEGAFVSFYVGDRRTLYPPTYFYTKSKGRFYYAAFLKDFQQSWDFAKEQFSMRVDMNQDALEEFLIKLGAGDSSTITERINEWRKVQ